MLDTATASNMVSTMVADIGTILTSGLTSVLGLLAVLIGLFFVIRFIAKRIGRPR